MNDALDAALWAFLADDILREMLRAPAVPAFAAPTVPPPARRS